MKKSIVFLLVPLILLSFYGVASGAGQSKNEQALRLHGPGPPPLALRPGEEKGQAGDGFCQKELRQAEGKTGKQV